MKNRAVAGVLLHPTALPGISGIGNIGGSAFNFIDLLAESGFSVWQFLPLHPTSFGNSPYSADSVFAGNPLLLDLHPYVSQGLLDISLLQHPDFSDNRVNFPIVKQVSNQCLRKIYQSADIDQRAFQEFKNQNKEWLDDYGLFRVLKTQNNEAPWYQWEKPYKFRDPSVLNDVRSTQQSEIDFHCFVQFLFFQQLRNLHQYSQEKGIQLLGDMPLFVALDSSDVWAQPHYFQLDNDLNPINVAGVPPDYFSETGQLWGNPVYNWDYHRETGYKFWIDRIRTVLEYVDMVRIDHFRGLEKYWSIPAEEETAVNGTWVEAPGYELFNTLKEKIGRVPLIAEDLGLITEEVDNLRKEFGFPGMKILQFAFGSGADNPYLPHNFDRNCVVYTGTHDNDTTEGWWQSMDNDQRNRIYSQLNLITGHDVKDPCHELIRLCLGSSAELAILPVQDIMHLDTRARFNTPGTPQGNWEWRLNSLDDLKKASMQLHPLLTVFNRLKINHD